MRETLPGHPFFLRPILDRQVEGEKPQHFLVEGADLPLMAARGEQLYRELDCRSCHEDGENPSRLDDLHERSGYAEVVDSLAYPQSPMPVFPLTDDERQALAVYLLWQLEGKD